MCNRFKNGEFKMATSDHLEQQLSYKLSPDAYGRFQELKEELASKNLLVHVDSNEQDERNAQREAEEHGTSWDDSKHFVLAQKAKAVFLVTQDLPHYTPFRSRIIVTEPRHLGASWQNVRR